MLLFISVLYMRAYVFVFLFPVLNSVFALGL